MAVPSFDSSAAARLTLTDKQGRTGAADAGARTGRAASEGETFTVEDPTQQAAEAAARQDALARAMSSARVVHDDLGQIDEMIRQARVIASRIQSSDPPTPTALTLHYNDLLRQIDLQSRHPTLTPADAGPEATDAPPPPPPSQQPQTPPAAVALAAATAAAAPADEPAVEPARFEAQVTTRLSLAQAYAATPSADRPAPLPAQVPMSTVSLANPADNA